MIELRTQGLSWIEPSDANFYGFHGQSNNGPAAVEYYNKKLLERREKYPFVPNSEASKHSEGVGEKGYHRIKNFFDEGQKNTLLEIRDVISNYVDENKHIKKRDNNMAHINQPILNIPNLYKIIFDDRIINIAAAHFNCVPAVTSVAVRKSFITDGPPVNNQYFHRDYNSLVKLLKVAVYFNDVDEDTGPFTYVHASNRKMFNKWWHYHYLQDDFLEVTYGKDNIKHLTANFGDLLLANTKGFHKGLKPKNKERIAMHICFMVHPELIGPNQDQESPPEDWFQIREEDYNSLPEWKKPVADILKRV